MSTWLFWEVDSSGPTGAGLRQGVSSSQGEDLGDCGRREGGTGSVLVWASPGWGQASLTEQTASTVTVKGPRTCP